MSERGEKGQITHISKNIWKVLQSHFNNFVLLSRVEAEHGEITHAFEQREHAHTFWVKNKLNFGFSSLFHNVWLPCGLNGGCVCLLNHFSPCSAAAAPAFTFLRGQDHARTTKIYKGQNKKHFLQGNCRANISRPAGLCIRSTANTLWQVEGGLRVSASKVARGLTISYQHSFGFADCTWLTMTSTQRLDIC